MLQTSFSTSWKFLKRYHKHDSYELSLDTGLYRYSFATEGSGKIQLTIEQAILKYKLDGALDKTEWTSVIEQAEIEAGETITKEFEAPLSVFDLSSRKESDKYINKNVSYIRISIDALNDQIDCRYFLRLMSVVDF